MNILVVDDEPLARERLVRLLQRVRPEARVATADSGEAALKQLAASVPDLVLLDIQMPGLDGLGVARRLGEMAQPPAVVFCTAHDEHALEALQQQAAGYLLKPVREAELSRALSQAGRVNRAQLASLASGQGGARRQLASHGHRGLETLAVAEVCCFLAEQKYVMAVAPGRELLLQETLRELEEEFGEAFLRVHRNALVAVAHVRRLRRNPDGTWTVELEGVSVEPQVSRRHLAQVKARLLE